MIIRKKSEFISNIVTNVFKDEFNFKDRELLYSNVYKFIDDIIYLYSKGYLNYDDTDKKLIESSSRSLAYILKNHIRHNPEFFRS